MSDIVRNGVRTADNLTKRLKLQVKVRYFAWTDSGDSGEPIYDKTNGTLKDALVVMHQRTIRNREGQDVQQKAIVTFLKPLTPNGAEGRREPLDPRDKIVLPNGYTGPILDVDPEGLVDPKTSAPYLNQAILG